MQEITKEILFIRHAKVEMDSSKPINAKSLKIWEDTYNNAPITVVCEYHGLEEKVKNAEYIVSSTLRRSVDSLALLDVTPDEQNSVFNEAAIPPLDGTFLKLKPANWLLLFRILSLLGVGIWANTLKKTKEDAQKGALRLQELSQQYDTIVIMGHGVMNWMIRKELLKDGWKREGKEHHGNCGVTLLHKRII